MCLAGMLRVRMPATNVCRMERSIATDEDASHGCPQKNGRLEQWRGRLEGSSPGCQPRMSAKKWAAGTMAWFAGKWRPTMPATDVRKKMGGWNPHPVWGFKNIKGGGGWWSGGRHAMSVSIVCKPPLQTGLGRTKRGREKEWKDRQREKERNKRKRERGRKRGR
jgi:hypothetical protein